MINLFLLLINKLFYPNRLKMPSDILGYKLCYLHKTSNSSNFATGIFIKDNTKYFIKIWRGYFHDKNFHSLYKEYVIGLYLNTYFDRLHIKQIRVPRSIDSIISPHEYIVVFEFVEGEQLEKLQINKKSEVYSYILKHMKISEHDINENLKNAITKKSQIDHIFELYSLFIPVMLTNFYKIPNIVKKCLTLTGKIRFQNDNTYTLCHSDLTEDNIIVSGKLIYILDWEHAIFASQDYEISSLSALQGDSKLMEILLKNVRLRPNNFLEFCIIIHHLFFAMKSADEKNIFISKI